jgi:hypothetical protein
MGRVMREPAYSARSTRFPGARARKNASGGLPFALGSSIDPDPTGS